LKAEIKVSNKGYGSAADLPIAPWTDLLRSAIKDLAELLDFVDLSRGELDEAPLLDAAFPLLVPRGFASRMRKRDPRDPLLRQVLPLVRERDAVPGFVRDPLDEIERAQSGVIRKYAGRALLVTTAACPIHCRYCFRRHFPYSDQSASRASWTDAVAALERARDVSEVILSGGDPLTLANGRLETLIDKLERLDHLRTLRIHTRFPVVLPERIDAGLLSILATSRLRTVVVVHCNHAQEIDAPVERALAALQSNGVMLLNQSVLLRGVNDDVATLRELSERLLDAHVLPYYLHALDPVSGSAHFDVPQLEALALVEKIRSTLPGYLVPRLVRELPGELSKTMLT
jgi:EF-P beta-lysylation protein EpmB